MVVIIRDVPTATAFSLGYERPNAVHDTDGRRIGWFTRTPTIGGQVWFSGEEVLARLREIRNLPPGTITPGHDPLDGTPTYRIRVADPVLAYRLAAADPAGVSVRDDRGRWRGRFVPEPPAAADEPFIVGGDDPSTEE